MQQQFQPTFYQQTPPPQQQQWQPQPGQFTPQPQPAYQQPPTPPKKKRSKTWLWIALALFAGMMIGYVAGISYAASLPTSQTTSATSEAAAPTQAPKAQPTTKPTVAPTQKPVPTESPAQTERAYKFSTEDTTVSNLDKDGGNDMAKQVHFTAKIIGFVKDDSGNTAGANVDTPDSYSSSIVQIEFAPNTDLSRLNQDDVVEVWGIDDGVSSGKNAYGGTVQEVSISAVYMTDQTTGYQANG